MAGVNLLYYANIYLWESLGNTPFLNGQDLTYVVHLTSSKLSMQIIRIL